MDMLYYLVVASYFIVFSLGFIISHLMRQTQVATIQQTSTEKPVSFLSKVQQEKVSRKIEIDDRTFITDVKTDTLEKKFDELGKKTVAQDTKLSANVNKLASLKKARED